MLVPRIIVLLGCVAGLAACSQSQRDGSAPLLVPSVSSQSSMGYQVPPPVALPDYDSAISTRSNISLL